MVSNRNFLFQGSIFRGYVSFREGRANYHHVDEFKSCLSDSGEAFDSFDSFMFVKAFFYSPSLSIAFPVFRQDPMYTIYG